MPESQTRPETGTMQFGDDWPGVFIRGDNAMGFAQSLHSLVAENVDPNVRKIMATPAKGLLELLLSCNTANKAQADQLLKSWNECNNKPKVYALIHGIDRPNNAVPNLHDEDCFGYYTSHDLAVKGLDKYFAKIGERWDYNEEKKEWRKGDYYVFIDEHEMNVEID